jgi:hypothetical protein
LNRSSDASIAEKEKLSSLEGAYYTGVGKMTSDTALAESEMGDLLFERTALVNSLIEEAKNITSVSTDIFSLIGEDIGLTGAQTLFWIFVVLIVLLEVALFATTDSFETAPVQEENEVDIVLKYVDALEKDNGSVILNSDVNIAIATNIPKKDCVRYRKLLKSIKYRGKSLISENNRMEWNVGSIKKSITDYFSKEEV